MTERAGSSPVIDRGQPDDLEACVALWIEALTQRDGDVPAEATADRCRDKFGEERVAFDVLRVRAA